MKVRKSRVQSGLDVCVRERWRRFQGRRVALLAHAASVCSRMRNVLAHLLAAEQLDVVRVFEPEHGFWGFAQDMETVHARAGEVEFVSLYGDTFDSLRPKSGHFDGVDVLICDLADVGSRYYTFANTAVLAAEAATSAGVEVWLLDRPNPLGGRMVEGPHVMPGYESFVGLCDIPVRHALSFAELVRFVCRRRGMAGENLPRVVPCRGWRRGMWWDDTGLPWVMPSPNMPTPDTATVYPGGCLIEGTTLSEGRGTTRPFEILGAPGIDGALLAKEVGEVPGAVLRPLQFKPMFHKHAGQVCGGVQVHVRHRRLFEPFAAYVRILAAVLRLFPESFGWRETPYEFVADRRAFDLLAGSDVLRTRLLAGEDPRCIVRELQYPPKQWMKEVRPFLLYE